MQEQRQLHFHCEVKLGFKVFQLLVLWTEKETIVVEANLAKGSGEACFLGFNSQILQRLE